MMYKMGSSRIIGFISRRAERHFSCVGQKTTVGHPRVVVSGTQPTGSSPHLGNYLGAIKLWAKLQEEPGDIYYSVVDLLALPIPVARSDTIYERLLNMMACLIAFGIDPERCVLYKQSDVKELNLLAWVLSCLVPQSAMLDMNEWKSKTKANKNAANLGLFTDAILVSANMMLFKATQVPIGTDQIEIVVFCQEVVKLFHDRYGHYFPEPEYVLDPNCAEVRSLQDASSKMSKSDPSDFGRINLSDSDDEIWRKIKSAKVDDIFGVTFDPIRRPGVTNLVHIHSAITGEPTDQICSRARGLDVEKYKIAVAETVIAHIKPMRSEYERLVKEKGYLNDVVVKNGRKAKFTAEKNWNEIAELVGLV